MPPCSGSPYHRTCLAMVILLTVWVLIDSPQCLCSRSTNSNGSTNLSVNKGKGIEQSGYQNNPYLDLWLISNQTPSITFSKTTARDLKMEVSSFLKPTSKLQPITPAYSLVVSCHIISVVLLCTSKVGPMGHVNQVLSLYCFLSCSSLHYRMKPMGHIIPIR